MSAGKSEILIKTPINISSACTIQNFCGPLQQCTSAEYFLVAFIVCTWCSGAACRLHTLHSAPPVGGPNPDIDVQFRRLALKSPPLGLKWGRWAKKLGCASNPPVCRLLVWEDWMRTQVFSPTYPTWALVGGTSRPAGETV